MPPPPTHTATARHDTTLLVYFYDRAVLAYFGLPCLPRLINLNGQRLRFKSGLILDHLQHREPREVARHHLDRYAGDTTTTFLTVASKSIAKVPQHVCQVKCRH